MQLSISSQKKAFMAGQATCQSETAALNSGWYLAVESDIASSTKAGSKDFTNSTVVARR
jgi:hypothetical protein